MMTRPPEDLAPPGLVAAFDLDGTVSWTDTFVSFVRVYAGRAAFWSAMAALAPAAVRYGLGALDRGGLKEAMLARALAGHTVERVADAASRFAQDHAPRLMRADARAALYARQADGARVIIVTACPEPVARPIAETLGADCVATRLEVLNGRYTGRLAGANCRGAEKVTRLRALIGPQARIVAAYGDSAGDAELLAAAEAGHLNAFVDGPRLRTFAALARLV